MECVTFEQYFQVERRGKKYVYRWIPFIFKGGCPKTH